MMGKKKQAKRGRGKNRTEEKEEKKLVETQFKKQFLNEHEGRRMKVEV